MITYEYPFNERIRTLLRLEDLFDKTAHFIRGETPFEHHVALLTLFEILDVAGRADLKVDLVQELERQRQSLVSFRNNPAVSEEALSGALYEIEQASSALLAMAGKIGQYLRENEWLMSIKSRAAIPGGVCEFDLPSYHYWLHGSTEQRRHDLVQWIGPVLPIRDGLAIVLRLLRETAHVSQQIAAQGGFQQALQGRAYALLQVRVPIEVSAVPETSANKYMLWIRFTRADGDMKPRPVERDVPFELALCAF